MLLDEILENKNEILDIFERYGVANVKIIGSVSKKSEKIDSDIDFVADLPKLPNGLTDLQAYIGVVDELSRYFCRKIELAPYEQINHQYPDALSKGIELRR